MKSVEEIQRRIIYINSEIADIVETQKVHTVGDDVWLQLHDAILELEGDKRILNWVLGA